MPALSRAIPAFGFEELDLVRLRSVIYLDKSVLPVGALGTIVHRHIDGDSYEVEFAEPVGTVLTLRTSDLYPAT